MGLIQSTKAPITFKNGGVNFDQCGRQAMLSMQSFLRKGVSLGYVGQKSNLKDLKDLKAVFLVTIIEDRSWER